MDLFENPFYILSATPGDNRARLVHLADERSLLADAETCANARSILTNPRRRLSAEIAWLPGVTSDNSEATLRWLSKQIVGRPNSSTMRAFTPLPRANVLASGLVRLEQGSAQGVSQWILELAEAFEDIKADQILGDLNGDRATSEFPEITDLAAVEAEISVRRRHYCQAIQSALDKLASAERIEAVTLAVESATNHGHAHGPVLIDDLIDAYEVEAQAFLQKEEMQIEKTVEKVRAAADDLKSDTVLFSLVTQLIELTRNWDFVAQPIQVSAMSRGIEHEGSRRVAGLLRRLSIDLYNEHDKLDLCKLLTKALQDMFAEVVQVAELIGEDTVALNQIEEDRAHAIEQAREQEEEWNKFITYEANVGSGLNERLCISPEGIVWKGREWKLDSISRIRWCGHLAALNGASYMVYNIRFGDDSSYGDVKLYDEEQYNNFIDRLWRAVGIRLMTEFLIGIREGKEYRFGGSVISDFGVQFEHKKWFSANERIFCPWSEIVKWGDSNGFCLGKENDQKFVGVFSYFQDDNIRILEFALNMFEKNCSGRLSSLLA